MKALSKRSILWLLWGGRQIISTWFCRAKVMTTGFFVCEYCPSATKTQGPYFVGFVCLMKWRSQWVNISLCIRPRGMARVDWSRRCAIHQLCFTHFLGNTSNGGMECPFGLIQLTNVTRDPRSTDLTADIWRLSFKPNIFVYLCCTIVTPVLSQW